MFIWYKYLSIIIYLDIFVFRVCHAFLPVHCSLVVTCWERDNLLVLLCVMFYCGFVTFPCGVLGQVWYLFVSNPDICPLTFMRANQFDKTFRVTLHHGAIG